MTALLQLRRERAVAGATLVGVLAASHPAADIAFAAVSATPTYYMVGSVGVVAGSALLSLVGTAPSLLVLDGPLLAGGLASAAMHRAFTSLARSHGEQRPGLATAQDLAPRSACPV